MSLAISDGDVPTVQQAVDAYALLNADMPGATPSDLPPGDGLGATFTRRLVESARGRLVLAQQAMVDAAYATPDEDDIVGTADVDDVADLTFTSAPDSSGPESSDGSGPAGFGGSRRPQAERPAVRYLRLLQETLAEWVRYRPDLPHRNAILAMMPTEIDGGGMDAWLDGGTAGPCTIRVSRSFWRRSRPADEIRFFFAHELFHCVQFGWFFGAGQPDWLIEGSADFAAADLMRARYTPSEPVVSSAWFTRTNVPLAARSYNSWPLFENVRRSGADAYGALRSMISAGVGGRDELLAIGQMTGVVFRMDWSSHTLRAAGLDATWQFDWPGTSGAGPHDNSSSFGTRGVGTYEIHGVGGYSQVQAIVDISSRVGLMTVVPHGAPLSTHSGERTVTAAEGALLRLCFDPDGCRCPDGSDSGAIRMACRDMIFSFAASDAAPTASVVAKRWDPDTECSKRRPRRATSNGDPHLVTFDGLPYDVQALGEVVSSRDPGGGFEVQTRNVPAVVGLAVAGTVAVAVSDGSSRVTFTMDGLDSLSPAVVRTDGEVIDASTFAAGSMEVDVSPAGDAASVSWPDGTIVELDWTAGWFVTVSAPDARAGRLVGLLGSADGDFRNDLLFPDGTAADVVEAGSRDSSFVQAWRVDDATTLFDYEAGESPATFNVDHPSNAVAITVSDEAADACAGALGNGATCHELEACAFDYAATGDESFVTAYEEVRDERIEAALDDGAGAVEVVADDPGIVAAGASQPSLELQGTLVSTGVLPVPADATLDLAGTISAGEGAVLLVRLDLCPADATVWVRVANVATGAGGTTTACDPMGLTSYGADEDDDVVPGEAYIWLSDGGDYNVLIDTDSEEPVFVDAEVFADQDPTVLGVAELADGDRTTLSGEGDTLVYRLGLDESAYMATGLGDVCVVEAWGAPPPGDGAVWPLGYCGHQSDIALGYAYSEVPVVVFARGPDAVDVELTPVTLAT